MNFFAQHQDQFEEGVEENKLEHTTIHEKYIYILEQYIDLTLNNKYGEDAVKAFYEDFRQNFQMYQGQNEEVVQTLLDFVDFNSFKNSILTFKASEHQPVDNSNLNQIARSGNADMFFKLEGEDPNDPRNGWVKKSEINKIDTKGFSLTFH